jgi:filamentous hemagglutinin family protein
VNILITGYYLVSKIKGNFLLFCLIRGIIFSILVFHQPIIAQIVPDNTLPVNSRVAPGCSICRIEGGTVKNSNLFHSFQKFSVARDGAAIFNNTADIQNVFTRVTGGNVSNINGLIQTSGNANLFLINPSGIIFGSNATLNINGSFVATTANGIGFASAGVFTANPNSDSFNQLLNINPNALFFNQVTPASIVNRSTISVQPLRSLLFVGGDISLEGGTLQAQGGRIELASVKEGRVGLSVEGNNLRLNIPTELPRKNISLTEGAIVDVAAPRGGNITVTAENLTMVNRTGQTEINGLTLLRAGVSGIGSLESKSGSIDIDVNKTIHMEGSTIENRVNTDVIGNSGDINIKAESLFVLYGSFLTTQIEKEGRGNAGNVNINASDILIDGQNTELQTGILSGVRPFGMGNSGSINITTNSLQMRNGSIAEVSTQGKGNVGTININARDRLELSGLRKDGFPTVIASTVEPTGNGNGGNINITTGSLSLGNGAFLVSRVAGIGEGGDITVNTNSLEAFSGGQINSTSSNLDAGNITINARDRISLSGSDPTIIPRLVPVVGENMFTGIGSASGMYANTNASATGTGGNLRISTGNLELRDGAVLNVSSLGNGGAGNLEITAESITLDNSSSLRADTKSGADGNIVITSQDLQLRRASNMSTNATGTAIGGNININTETLVALENSDITANATANSGGTVIINAQGILGTRFREQMTPESDITATSGLGTSFNGMVNINTLAMNPNIGLFALPEIVIDTSTQIAAGCPASKGNNFVVAGRGGLASSPNDLFAGNEASVDLVDLVASSSNIIDITVSNFTTNTSEDELVEAQGIIVDANGEAFLIARAQKSSLHSPGITQTNKLLTPVCHKFQQEP